MRRFIFLAGSLIALNIALFMGSPGCGNTVIEVKQGDGGAGNGGAAGSAGTGGGYPDAGPDVKDALPDYVDPGCPESGPPPTDFECDAFDQTGCGPGEGCYISVQYPDEPCAQEIYGSYCAPSGPGAQGDPCGGGPDCGAGFCCVITGFGTQCVQLCPLTGSSGCPDGLTCEAIDVEGFGGCF